MQFKNADEIRFIVTKGAANRAVLTAMKVGDAYKPIILNKHDLKSWRNCAYRYGTENNKIFAVMKADDGAYYVVRNA